MHVRWGGQLQGRHALCPPLPVPHSALTRDQCVAHIVLPPWRLCLGSPFLQLTASLSKWPTVPWLCYTAMAVPQYFSSAKWMGVAFLHPPSCSSSTPSITLLGSVVQCLGCFCPASISCRCHASLFHQSTGDEHLACSLPCWCARFAMAHEF